MAEAPLPSVEFLSQVRDGVQAALHWLRQPRPAGVRVRVLGEPVLLQQLSGLLWTQDREGFLPHLLTLARSGLAPTEPGIERTPVWLGPGPVAGPEPDWLLNLGSEMPDDVARYVRVVEIVTTDPEGRQAGRVRWAAYRAMGIEPSHRSLDVPG